MQKQKAKQQNKKPKKEILKRVVVWVLAALMVLGVAFPVISGFLSYSTRAVHIADTDDTIVRIGLLYGSNAVSAFLTRSPYGFRVCAVNRGTDEVVDLYKLSSTALEATVDENLTIVNGDYKPIEGSADIGAYHAMLNATLTLDELYLAMHVAVLNGSNAPMIASYANGAYRLFVGSFKSAQDAQIYIDNAGDIFAGFTKNEEEISEMVVYTPSKTAVNLLDPTTNMTVFNFDGGTEWDIGLMAQDSPDGETAYLQTPANKLYDGIFLFSRCEGGVMLVNYLGLEDYTMGVLPYEISNSWPLETQKAFAVAVRSYSVNKLGRHEKKYGFDMCNTVCCQSYNGVRNVNDTVRRAVSETKGLVLVSSEGEIISTYYSAVAGGTTVSAKEAWGGSGESYLQAKPTPWEDYSTHANGTWTWSVSPSELAKVLNERGYSDIKGDITDVRVEYAENSDYVYRIIFTDLYGNIAMIKNCDTIRSTLAPHIKSANFKVGRGSLDVNDPAFADDNAKVYFSKINGDGKISYINWTEPMEYLSSKGSGVTWASQSTPVIRGGGEIEYVDRTITVKANSDKDFIFVGRGWGHGVGLSQVGAYSLGHQGFDAKFILTAYFADTHLERYSDIVAKQKANALSDDDTEE